MSCQACDWIEKSKKIYEDDKLVAILAKQPANPGHTIVIPKKHYTILEQIPDKEVQHHGIVINKITRAIFESMNIQGVSVLMQNGIAAHQKIPHFMTHIIPRMENDDVGLVWQPRQLSEEEMSTVELQLNEQTKKIETVDAKPLTKVNIDNGSSHKKQKVGNNQSDEINYLIKQLERIP
ncbi:MAG: hypothetical protein MAG795_01119 [Candidatus Woesearchaeota archaeon]|nr:hypothetical protein [Candidatus Woesearchaeota archaeon]